MTTARFGASVDKFKAASPWLSDEHEPAVAALEALAASLDDDGITAALVAQFGLTYRALAKLAPAATPESVDPLEAAMKAAGVA